MRLDPWWRRRRTRRRWPEDYSRSADDELERIGVRDNYTLTRWSAKKFLTARRMRRLRSFFESCISELLLVGSFSILIPDKQQWTPTLANALRL